MQSDSKMVTSKTRLPGSGIARAAGLLLIPLLAACGLSSDEAPTGGIGGGGGGTGGGTTGLPTPDPLSAFPPPATTFETTEFFVNHGLGQMGTQYAYAEGASGAGVVVAVIDTGIDPDHPDLINNLSSDSIDIVRGGLLTDEAAHGTHVAGIIAAEKNDIGTHGVAFDATILAIRTDTRTTEPTECGDYPTPCSRFLIEDIANALDYAAGKAHVINMSVGGPDSLAETVETALINAMAAGAIIPVAAGNENTISNPALEPLWPAAYAGDARINASGQLIAVGAVDENNVIAGFSNQCGSARNFCLVAPGVAITSTVPGGGTATHDGTSLAAPHVSGGAALLIQMFPTLAPGEVVQIMLVTATDLGVPGIDAVYGHGLLNLRQAVQPVGVLSVPLTGSVTGQSVDMTVTLLSLGSAFGDALAGNALLDGALALDDFDRAYAAGLGAGVVYAGRGFGLGALLATGDAETVEAALPGGLTLAMAVSGTEDTESLSTWPSGDGDENAAALQALSLSGETPGGTAFRLGRDMTASQQLSGGLDTRSAGLYWMAEDTLNPHYALVGAGTGAAFVREIGGATTATLGLVDQTGAAAESGEGDARIGELTMSHRFAGGATLRAGFALIDEVDGFLGSDAAGAFAVAGASSRAYTLGSAVPLGAGVELVGSYTLVNATMEADGASLLSDWGAVRADAFGLGVARRGVFGAGDRIGLLVGQPLRVSDASATLTAPVDYTLDKTVIQESERISLAPTGREIDLQLAYDTALPGDSRVSSWLMMQVEPGHVADANPAYGVGLRFSSEF